MGEIQGRYRGDVYRGDLGETYGRCRGDIGEISRHGGAGGESGRWPCPHISRTSPLHLPYISPTSPPHLPCIFSIPPLYLHYTSPISPPYVSYLRRGQRLAVPLVRPRLELRAPAHLQPHTVTPACLQPASSHTVPATPTPRHLTGDSCVLVLVLTPVYPCLPLALARCGRGFGCLRALAARHEP